MRYIASPKAYQKANIEGLHKALPEYRCAIDASDMGCGKTYIALFTMRALGLRPYIVAPKTILTTWKRACEHVDISPAGIINYESLVRGGTNAAGYWETKAKKNWVWDLDYATDSIIFDEGHRLKGDKSLAHKTLIGARMQGIITLVLSATLAEDPTQMKALGFALGLFRRPTDWWNWALANGCHRPRFGNKFLGIKFVENKEEREWHLKKIHIDIGPRMVRLKKSEIPGFPSETTECVALDTSNSKRINDIYVQELEALKLEAETPMTVQLRTRQQIEYLKVDALIQFMKDLREEGLSLVVFVCFRQTLQELVNAFPDASLIYGGQKDRDEQIDRFQANESKICLATADSANAGINLGDEHGGHPRAALMCPHFNAVTFIQCFGRIPRINSQSKCLQYIITAAGTLEDKIRRKVEMKKENITLINDGDLSL